MTLSHNSRRILAAVMQARQDGTPPPSIRDLMELTGISNTNGLKWHLWRLARLGLVKWEDGKARTLVPTCRFLEV